MNGQELNYLKTIKRRLDEFKMLLENGNCFALSIGSEALNDEINWLDCFIDQHERTKK